MKFVFSYLLEALVQSDLQEIQTAEGEIIQCTLSDVLFEIIQTIPKTIWTKAGLEK